MATILLVDDVELFLELERSFLEDSGHRVLTAGSGEEALSRLEQAEPDLVLLDLNLPGADGDEICRRLRGDRRWESLPIVMVTASGREEEIRKCLDAGCSDYLTKPVSKNELVKTVNRLLGAVRGRTESRVPSGLPVEVTGGGRRLNGDVRDISGQGIFVRSRTCLTPGTAVELKLELPDGGPLQMLGKVVRVQDGPEGGMGIYFISAEAQGLKTLRSLLSGRTAVGQVSPEEAQVPQGELERRNVELEERVLRLQQRISELEAENREFAERIVQTEELNNSLTNIYIASSQLHSVLDRSRVAEIIGEVIINLVGAEKFALLVIDKDSRQLCYEAGEGFDAGAFQPLSPDEGVFGPVVEKGESFFVEGSVAEGSDDPLRPLAAIPLRIEEETIGVLTIYRLFIHKEKFEQVDFSLFSMLAEHASTALFTASLFGASERKRKAYRGFMDLLLR